MIALKRSFIETSIPHPLVIPVIKTVDIKCFLVGSDRHPKTFVSALFSEQMATWIYQIVTEWYQLH